MTEEVDTLKEEGIKEVLFVPKAQDYLKQSVLETTLYFYVFLAVNCILGPFDSTREVRWESD